MQSFQAVLCSVWLANALLCPLRGITQVAPHLVSDGNTGIPLITLVAQSTAIFEGRALQYRGFWNREHTRIHTATLVEVYKVFKGQVADRAEVVVEGGTTASGEGMAVSHGSVSIGNGAIGLFFAVPFNDPTLQPGTFDQQVYRVLYGDEGFFVYCGYHLTQTPLILLTYGIVMLKLAYTP